MLWTNKCQEDPLDTTQYVVNHRKHLWLITQASKRHRKAEMGEGEPHPLQNKSTFFLQNAEWNKWSEFACYTVKIHWVLYKWLIIAKWNFFSSGFSHWLIQAVVVVVVSYTEAGSCTCFSPVKSPGKTENRYSKWVGDDDSDSVSCRGQKWHWDRKLHSGSMTWGRWVIYNQGWDPDKHLLQNKSDVFF